MTNGPAENTLRFWRDFFADLFIGSLMYVAITAGFGGLLGFAAVTFVDRYLLQTSTWSPFAQGLLYWLSLLWFVAFGILHSVGFCLAWIGDNKLKMAVNGLHDLLDYLTRGACEAFAKSGRKFSKSELESAFDRLADDFTQKLALTNKFLKLIAGAILGVVLKGLKLLFVNDILGELEKKNQNHLTHADIESAVRRVGVAFVLAPVHDTFILTHIFNFVLMLLSYTFPTLIIYFILQ